MGTEASASACGLSKSPGASSARLRRRAAKKLAAAMSTTIAIGHFGIPGSARSTNRVPSTISGIFGTEVSWLTTSVPSWRSEDERVTMMPVATEMISAGTWVTMPSPIVSRVNFDSASLQSMPISATPTIHPAMISIRRMMMPAMASPLTNLLAPSIAP